MMRVLLIGAGGFLGSISRYLLSGVAQRLFEGVVFPYGTFAVNVMGCLIIGGLSYLAESHGVVSDHQRAFIVVGFLGGFTTFSAFANESVNLIRDGETFLAAANVAGQVLICLGAVWLGRAITYALWR